MFYDLVQGLHGNYGYFVLQTSATGSWGSAWGWTAVIIGEVVMQMGDSALMETCWLLVLLLLCFCSGPLWTWCWFSLKHASGLWGIFISVFMTVTCSIYLLGLLYLYPCFSLTVLNLVGSERKIFCSNCIIL